MHRHNPQQLQAQTLETPARKIRNVVHLVHAHLVHHDPDNLNALAVKESLIEGHFVDRSTDSSGGDKNNLTAKEAGDGGIRKIENRSDPRMTAPLDDGEVFFPTGTVEGMSDSFDKGFMVGLSDVAAREVRLHRDGAHVLNRNPSPKCGLNEKAVIVDAMSIHLGETLANRLDITNLGKASTKSRIKPKRSSRLARILLRGGNENTGRCGVHRISPPYQAADKVSCIQRPGDPQLPPSLPYFPRKLPSGCQRQVE